MWGSPSRYPATQCALWGSYVSINSIAGENPPWAQQTAGPGRGVVGSKVRLLCSAVVPSFGMRVGGSKVPSSMLVLRVRTVGLANEVVVAQQSPKMLNSASVQALDRSSTLVRA